MDGQFKQTNAQWIRSVNEPCKTQTNLLLKIHKCLKHITVVHRAVRVLCKIADWLIRHAFDRIATYIFCGDDVTVNIALRANTKFIADMTDISTRVNLWPHYVLWWSLVILLTQGFCSIHHKHTMPLYMYRKEIIFCVSYWVLRLYWETKPR